MDILNVVIGVWITFTIFTCCACCCISGDIEHQDNMDLYFQAIALKEAAENKAIK